MITIALPNGREVEIDTNDPQAAARAAQNIFRNESPAEFAEWNRNRSLGGFFENFAQAGRGAAGSVVGGAGALAGEAGLPGEQTLRGVGEAIEGEQSPTFRTFEGASDLMRQFVRRPGETAMAGLGQAAGSIAGSVAAPLAAGALAAGLGASAPVIAGVGLGAGILTGALQSTGELDQLLRSEGVEPERARELAAQIGPAIGALEGGAGAILLGRLLGRPVRRETAEQLARIAARSRTRAVAGGAAGGVGLEGGSEVLGESARQGVAAVETGNPNLAERADQVALEGILGAVGGGAVGGVAGARERAAAQRAVAPPEEAPPTDQPPPPPAPEPTGPVLPDEPAPLEDLGEALRLLDAYPEFRVPPDSTDAAVIARANDVQRALYRDEVGTLRDQELRRFTGLGSEVVRPGEPDAEGNRADETDYSPGANTLLRNILDAQGTGQLEPGRFTTNQVAELSLEGLGLPGSSLTTGERQQLTSYLNGLASQGFLRKAGKTSYEIAERPPQTPRPASRPGEAPQTAEEAAVGPVLEAISVLQTNPTQANVQTVQRAAEGTQLAPEVQQYLGLVTDARALADGRRALNINDPTQAEALRIIDQQLRDISNQQADIIDSLEGRAAGRLRSGDSRPAGSPAGFVAGQDRSELENRDAGAAAFTSAYTGVPTPTIPTAWMDVADTRARQDRQAETAADPTTQLRDERQVAEAIIERPAEAEAFVRSLAEGLPAGSRFDSTTIERQAQTQGVPLSRTTAVQLYDVARRTGVVNRTGVLPATPPAANFAQAGTLPPRTQLDRDAGRQGAEAAFRRMLGANGRLEFRDQIFLEQLGERVKAAAEAAGITEVDGIQIGDLAIIAMRDPKTPLTSTAIHEGYHVAERLGLFTPNEIALLNAAQDQIRQTITKYLPNVKDATVATLTELRAYGMNARVMQNADFGATINRIFDKLTNFLERIGNFMRGQGFQTWRDVYDAFYSGGMANRTPSGQDLRGLEVGGMFATAGALRTTPQVQRATADTLKGPLRFFGSPIMTIGKVLPQMRAAADTQRTLYTRSNEMINATESLIEAAHKLEPASVAKITRIWEQASRTRKKPDLSSLTQAEREALEGEMAAVQRALDFFIESSALQQFLPTADKSPAVRQRLERFWARHTDKHLWEIPQRELLAASPEGYREMQKYERLRNPYYMPMIGRGSHFVAAYKRKPNGERGDLVGLVAYQPKNSMQRMRGFADPEADAVAQLTREFDPKKHVIMQQGRQFTNDSQAQDVRNNADFIAQYMERIRSSASAAGNTELLRTVREMSTQMDKATMERIFRPNRDILRAVTPANESSYILDVMPQYLLSMSKVQARRYTQDAYKDATAALSPRDKEYWDTLRDYATSPSEAFGGLRASAFFMYLGGAIDTAAINLTQNFHTAAMIARDGGVQGTKTFLKTAKDLFVNIEARKLLSTSNAFLENVMQKLPADERAAMQKAIEQGIFAPVFTNESRSQFTVEGLSRAGFKNARRAQQILTKTSHILGAPMQHVEEYNRSVAFLTAYRMAKTNPGAIARANKVDNTNYTDPYGYAVGKVIDTQFLTTKEDRAYMQRFAPIAEVMTQFMSYPFKTIEQYAMAGGQLVRGLKASDPILAKAGAVSLLGMVVPLIGLAGLFALPFAASLSDWAEKLIGFIWESPQNFELEMREALGGGKFAEAIVRGIPHAQGWASLSRRLALDPVPSSELSALSLATLFGPAGSMAEIPVNAYQYYRNGDYWQMAATLMPRAAGNVVRGMQLEFDQEQYTRRGNRVITPENVRAVNERAATPLGRASVRQALGFPPPEFVGIRDTVGLAEDLNQATRGRSERVSKELAGILVDMMDNHRRGDAERAAEAVRRYGLRFGEIMQAEADRPLHLRINPTHATILRRALRDFHGIGSEEALRTTGRAGAREEAVRQRQVILGQ